MYDLLLHILSRRDKSRIPGGIYGEVVMQIAGPEAYQQGTINSDQKQITKF